MADSIRDQIQKKIESKKVVVYSKSGCPYCTKAKRVFQKMMRARFLAPADYEVIEIERDPDCAKIQQEMNRRTGGRTVN